MTIDNDEELDREFHLLADDLSHEPRYFMHRDFQSQNIYFKDGAVRYIDFQTATRGLLQYDAVSLLKDAYVVLQDSQREALLDFYLDMLIGVWGLALEREAFVAHLPSHRPAAKYAGAGGVCLPHHGQKKDGFCRAHPRRALLS